MLAVSLALSDCKNLSSAAPIRSMRKVWMANKIKGTCMTATRRDWRRASSGSGSGAAKSGWIRVRGKNNFYVSPGVFWLIFNSVLSLSSTMLTTRGAVARLSKRAFKSAKQTNAFFSSAALAQRTALPASSQQSRVSAPRSAPSSSVPGWSPFSPCFSLSLM